MHNPEENFLRPSEGADYKQLRCPGCGERYAMLPIHMRACEGVGPGD